MRFTTESSKKRITRDKFWIDNLNLHSVQDHNSLVYLTNKSYVKKVSRKLLCDSTFWFRFPCSVKKQWEAFWIPVRDIYFTNHKVLCAHVEESELYRAGTNMLALEQRRPQWYSKICKNATASFKKKRMTFTPGSDDYCLGESKDNFFSTKHERSAASIWLGSIPFSRHMKIMNAKNSQFHAWKLSMKYFCYKSFQEAQHSFHI